MLACNTEPIKVYTIQLDANGEPSHDDRLIRLPPPTEPYGVRFVLRSGTPASFQPKLKINIPEKGFRSGLGDEVVSDIKIHQAGVFSYRVEFPKDPRVPNNDIVESNPGYLIVDPILQFKKQSLSLDGINLITAVPKWLGPLTRWNEQLAHIAQLGYNTIHFVPPQTRGASDSPYSIQDQLALSSDLFEGKDKTLDADKQWKLLGKLLDQAREKHGFTHVVDIVLNHTAHTTPWLEEHPEAGYNLENSPHLTPAHELDTKLMELNKELETKGLPVELHSEDDLMKIINFIKDKLIPDLKLYEYYAIDSKNALKEFQQHLRTFKPNQNKKEYEEKLNEIHANLTIEQLSDILLNKIVIDYFGIRYGRKLNNELILNALIVWKNVDWLNNADQVNQNYEKLIEIINLNLYREYDKDVVTIITHLTNTLRYERIANHGPKRGMISPMNPLFQSYFTRLPKNQKTSKFKPGALSLANNGWVWAADPANDFVSSTSKAYLTREVIVWSDCVKLRYGKSRDDNPWLWDHMKKYTQLLARHFHGFRIDNCHSTPIPLAEYFMDCARQINPNLYVMAELFTGSEDSDRVYMSRLGINSLIREAMQAHDPHELSRLIHKYGGSPIGSLNEKWRIKSDQFDPTGVGSPVPCHLIPVKGRTPHALFMDCTHDNETPHQKRSVIDSLPNAALVAMTYSSIGSVMGYDYSYPKLLHLVDESRFYQIPKDPLAIGLGNAKKLLNELHYKLCIDGYNEVHVHHETNYVMVHRQHPEQHDGYLLIANTAFPGADPSAKLQPVKLRKNQVELVCAYQLVADKSEIENFKPSLKEIQGLPTSLKELKFNKFESKSDHLGPYVELDFTPESFPPGSIIVLKTKLDNIDTQLVNQIGQNADTAVNDLDFIALNFLLYRIDSEERDLLGHDHGSYDIPGLGTLPYCGLQGIISILKPIMDNNNLGHPLCENLRQGTWLLDYTVERLKLHIDHSPSLQNTIKWLDNQFNLVKKFPNFLIPKYFSLVIFSLYNASTNRAWEMMNPFIQQGDSFVKSAALVSIQLRGLIKSASLHPTKLIPGLAAGVPHFSTQYMRCWGRDTFISLRGLFLATGNYDAAREHLVAFAGSVKHGLIPNLLDSVRLPRYNSRDSVWWFLQSLQDYCTLAPEGLQFLQTKIPLRFPLSDEFVEHQDSKAFSTELTLAEVVQTIMERHYSGIEFREWNAGHKLDSHMSDEGFNIKIRFDPETGFLYGGNTKNCGTWMDKMGESVKAGTMGVPASPRDGAPVEIIGMLKSTIRWLSQIGKTEHFKSDSVVNSEGIKLTYQEWDQLLQNSFEKYFYVPENPSEYGQFQIDETLVHRTGVYKDVVGSEHKFTDYQLRPNFLVAMTVAPELFTPSRALKAIDAAEKILVGPKGMKTLDPNDSNYRGDYDNSNDSNDRYIAKGFNYHQGPEWGWCLGYYLMASYLFRSQYGSPTYNQQLLVHDIQYRLLGFRDEVKNSLYAGIPELTNKDGAFCYGSCASQAWSAATALDALFRVFSHTQHRNQSSASSSPTKESKNKTKPKRGKN